MYMPCYGDDVRGAPGRIVVYLSPNHPTPAAIPPELQEHVMAEEWSTRLPAISKIGARYYKPLFERIWLALATISIIVVPIAVYDPIYRVISKDDPNEDDHFWTARSISFGIFLAILLLFWGPILIWKGIGKAQMRKLLASYAKYDQMMKRQANFIPVWNATTPTLFSSQVILSITVPPRPVGVPSAFGPGAPLPPYIAPPTDAAGAYFYPYAASQQGQDGIPRMSVVGNIPANNSYGFGLGYGPGTLPNGRREVQESLDEKV